MTTSPDSAVVFLDAFQQSCDLDQNPGNSQQVPMLPKVKPASPGKMDARLPAQGLSRAVFGFPKPYSIARVITEV